MTIWWHYNTSPTHWPNYPQNNIISMCQYQQNWSRYQRCLYLYTKTTIHFHYKSFLILNFIIEMIFSLVRHANEDDTIVYTSGLPCNDFNGTMYVHTGAVHSIRQYFCQYPIATRMTMHFFFYTQKVLWQTIESIVVCRKDRWVPVWLAMFTWVVIIAYYMPFIKLYYNSLIILFSIQLIMSSS